MAVDKLLRAGIAASKAGDVATAAALFSRVVQADPRSAEGWFWLGKSLPQYERQVYCFRRVLKIDPAHVEARRRLEKLGYLKPEPPKESPPPFSEPVPATISPFSVDPEDVFVQDYHANEEETEGEPPPIVELVPDPEPSEKKEEERKKKKGLRVLVAVFSVLALFCLAAVVGLFFLQPNLLTDIAVVVIPPTLPPAPTATATATVVPTPTALPFSALEMVEYMPVFEASDCTFAIPAGVQVDCGFVVVPENRYGDANKTIRLAVAIYRGSDSSAVPILYLQGGPGQETVKLMSEYFDWTVAPFLAERDFILLDQRGMGLSEPNLDCPKLDKVFEEDATNKIPFDQREERYLTAFDECRNTLTAQGVRLSSYNTMENAADVKDVILALGYQQATLFGVSYGTRLAQVVMRENPEVVYSAVLDSVLPIESKVYNESAAIAQASLDTLFAGCAADPDCQKAYPNLEEDLREVVAQLEAKPLHTKIFGYDEDDYSHSVDGTEFMSTILWAMRDSDLQGVIPQAIGRAKSGEANMLGFILSLPVNAINDINLGSYLSINCREQVYASTPKEVSEDLASYPDTEEVGLSWVYGDPDFIFNLCDTWQVEGLRPDENAVLSSDIPTLVMAGEYDSTTPPFWSEQVAARLSRSTFVEFPGQGHGVAFSQDSFCPQEIVQSFFANPEITPDISCAAEMPPPEFSVPYKGEPPLTMIPIVNKEAGVITSAPASWTFSEDNTTFYREASSWDMTSVSVLQVGLDFDTVMGMVVGDYEGIGLDSYPVRVGETTANGLTWELYETTAISLPVDIAYAQDGYDAIMIIFLSHADERDILYEEVFQEMLKTTVVFFVEETQ